MKDREFKEQHYIILKGMYADYAEGKWNPKTYKQWLEDRLKTNKAMKELQTKNAIIESVSINDGERGLLKREPAQSIRERQAEFAINIGFAGCEIGQKRLEPVDKKTWWNFMSTGRTFQYFQKNT